MRLCRWRHKRTAGLRLAVGKPRHDRHGRLDDCEGYFIHLKRFGGRDHTTVMHAVKRITQLRGDDVTFDAQIRAIEETLKG
ncbi:hypothetical protein GCM10007854_19830 [Algimonas porphyrae]|uniref:Chromosomal replication initiator protein DnaA n=1 Tax=Algimonas porphyrae TaxID=1128113 RepID=A0ABQ5V0S7_9PROT|nr:hypothetical protein GCM10007854_19830 [Algimonas porphyrae]